MYQFASSIPIVRLKQKFSFQTYVFKRGKLSYENITNSLFHAQCMQRFHRMVYFISTLAPSLTDEDSRASPALLRERNISCQNFICSTIYLTKYGCLASRCYNRQTDGPAPNP